MIFTRTIQRSHNVTVGDRANFTCCARGTNITVYWEIQGREYRDCSIQAFCVTYTSEVNSVSSTLEIDTTQPNGTEIGLHCVVEQSFGQQTARSISSGQLNLQGDVFMCMLHACIVCS